MWLPPPKNSDFPCVPQACWNGVGGLLPAWKVKIYSKN